MYKGLRVAVVIPAFNAGERLRGVIETLPAFVDLAIVVDDGSVADPVLPESAGIPRLELIHHPMNMGVGAAILTGYRKAREEGAGVAVVMAADGQMDPFDLEHLLAPIVCGDADYVKGDRLSHPDCARHMPRVRFFGNCCLTCMTRVVTGQWGLMDSQCGYTAVRLDLLDSLPLDWLYPRYGFPNDMLAAMAGVGARVADVTVAPVYGGEKSGIRPAVALLVYPMILARGLLVRMVARMRRGRNGVAVGEAASSFEADLGTGLQG
ncbi:MAG: glycosyltransferase family 2 protein [Deltaproteobacteria bacterium]|nr:glycosyltransferase family 2 protein [Deltaproteobacteria bacterium]